ncbi:O-6-methylguanine DNA methyltransferase [Burkholderia sp. Ch1-1]|uniref:Methylated-DNA--protein-cysteine methyltransferase n=1 Tax=Paraburkholderia dioscoreae TaxID=2604047 RepID=A0A5Q4ZKI4_9BURK|nr:MULTISPECIES: methylated-DNA--[protein]-cysteine S-methyltransferase [Paraburkholderia]EIF34953.1 O-6-methylguanine DNA methyltransferase [Burkholderia sp. Ch1-1]MDR8396487.1 methylated-DNA--[protein]-cysteine S-methyltransferase [Paraburkholderia sp. USG1]VVD34135.1 Methylated-DNA--protein-cysteine methyltransferase [Paraburkholderia dioscoreae]
MTYAYKLMDSPVGQLKLVANGERLAAILWENDKPNRVRLGEWVEANDRPVLIDTERQLNEYFAGTRREFDLPLAFQGTEFQKQVWAALLTIPFGQTRSYAEIAMQIGNVNAVRAVGAANGRNPISIVAPCHRVIGASGDLTGFAGGLANKMFLLSLEAGQTSLEAQADRQTDMFADEGKAKVEAQARSEAQTKPARHAPSRGTQSSLFGT